ncbi:Uncharacterised protein [Salmonella enterica subsp. enterica serovar Bovismorbificans]|uniref:Uncharacterized protein n=2 Tax=Salmonella enterica I TaxID=59201 RepID=A0A447N334_SALET|nr:Uncharacterised protein [Salmonella enterica subsp. enterica serovar Typhi]CGX51131.1 Uncharacterised protein [Salmonella enterica subsp. enterica serovar Typhi]CNU97517.1 Uncharacterised protein [Salmonella enterica subsp. enterica serovar Bovismorbificans]SUG03656.1 Uncharacterised protein [Salmonella enterica subsp. enterica serovar Pullorum]VDZ97725.1 Uncharacterised protein [Salmonella enterica subsp. enterica]
MITPSATSTARIRRICSDGPRLKIGFIGYAYSRVGEAGQSRDNPARIQLLFAEQVAAVHIDHFQRLAAAARHTGQRIFSNHDRNARLFH